MTTFRSTIIAAAATIILVTPLRAQELGTQQLADLGNTQAGLLIHKYESRGCENIPNFHFDKTHTAGGCYQITDTDWKEIAPSLGFDLVKWPNAGSAPKFEQGQVAFKMWKERGCLPWAPFNPKLASAGLCSLPGGRPDLAAHASSSPPPMPPAIHTAKKRRFEWIDDEDDDDVPNQKEETKQ